MARRCAVETQASLLDYVVVPMSTKSGMHDLRVIVEDYEKLHEEVSASFSVLRGLDRLTIYFYIILVAIFLVGLLAFPQIRSLKKKVQ